MNFNFYSTIYLFIYLSIYLFTYIFIIWNMLIWCGFWCIDRIQGCPKRLTVTRRRYVKGSGAYGRHVRDNDLRLVITAHHEVNILCSGKLEHLFHLYLRNLLNIFNNNNTVYDQLTLKHNIMTSGHSMYFIEWQPE